MLEILAYYLLAINIITFAVYGFDKWKARNDRWRTPESTLLLLAFFGGSIGALLGMQVWHHKTQHWKFRLGVPLILVLQVAFIVWLAFFRQEQAV